MPRTYTNIFLLSALLFDHLWSLDFLILQGLPCSSFLQNSWLMVLATETTMILTTCSDVGYSWTLFYQGRWRNRRLEYLRIWNWLNTSSFLSAIYMWLPRTFRAKTSRRKPMVSLCKFVALLFLIIRLHNPGMSKSPNEKKISFQTTVSILQAENST